MQSRTTGPPVSGTNQSTVTRIPPIVKYTAIDPCQTLAVNLTVNCISSFLKNPSQGLQSSPHYTRFYVSYIWHTEESKKPQKLCVCRYIANETLYFTDSGSLPVFTNSTLECPHTYSNNKVKMFWKVFHQNITDNMDINIYSA